MPQSHRPGVEAEVDFGDVTVRLAGQTVVCYLFSFRLSYSGKAVHRIFASGGQEAFFEGHVHALSVLGGAPTGRVRYDNMKAAVAKVIGFTRERRENERWVTFREHYSLDSSTAAPAWPAPTRREGWKETSATSVATTWSRSPRWTHWPS